VSRTSRSRRPRASNHPAGNSGPILQGEGPWPIHASPMGPVDRLAGSWHRGDVAGIMRVEGRDHAIARSEDRGRWLVCIESREPRDRVHGSWDSTPRAIESIPWTLGPGPRGSLASPDRTWDSMLATQGQASWGTRTSMGGAWDSIEIGIKSVICKRKTWLTVSRERVHGRIEADPVDPRGRFPRGTGRLDPGR
jgi:hypothetical protein